jgi:hypothetical protein
MFVLTALIHQSYTIRPRWSPFTQYGTAICAKGSRDRPNRRVAELRVPNEQSSTSYLNLTVTLTVADVLPARSVARTRTV